MATAVSTGYKILTFFRLGRPHFLVGGVVTHALSVAAALWAGASLNMPALALSQLAITATRPGPVLRSKRAIVLTSLALHTIIAHARSYFASPCAVLLRRLIFSSG